MSVADEMRPLASEPVRRHPCLRDVWHDHVLLTGEDGGYYADYADRPAARLGRGLAEGFIYQGDPSRYRDGERRGEP